MERWSERKRGRPQGGPLRPLLANILLADLDKELTRKWIKVCTLCGRL